MQNFFLCHRNCLFLSALCCICWHISAYWLSDEEQQEWKMHIPNSCPWAHRDSWGQEELESKWISAPNPAVCPLVKGISHPFDAVLQGVALQQEEALLCCRCPTSGCAATKNKQTKTQTNLNQKFGGGRNATYILVISRAICERVPHALQEEQRELFG